MLDRHGETVPKIQENVLPMNLEIGDPQVLLAVVLAVVGFALIFGLELFAEKKRSGIMDMYGLIGEQLSYSFHQIIFRKIS